MFKVTVFLVSQRCRFCDLKHNCCHGYGENTYTVVTVPTEIRNKHLQDTKHYHYINMPGRG
jgi:hypothetical protein